MEVQEDVAGVGVTISTTDSDRLEVLSPSLCPPREDAPGSRMIPHYPKDKNAQP